MHELFKMHIRETNGLKKDNSSIQRLLRKSAAALNPDSCKTLAVAYEYGWYDLPVDFEEASKKH